MPRPLFNTVARGVPDDKRLISFRIAHTTTTDSSTSPATSPRSPRRSPRNTPSPGRAKKVFFPFEDGVEESKAVEPPELSPERCVSPPLSSAGCSPPEPLSPEGCSPPQLTDQPATLEIDDDDDARTMNSRFSDNEEEEAEEELEEFDNTGLRISGLERRCRMLERALKQERETNCALRLRTVALKRELEAAKYDCAAARKEATSWRNRATNEAALASEAAAGLEREAELTWREAEEWVEHEERMERRENCSPRSNRSNSASPALNLSMAPILIKSAAAVVTTMTPPGLNKQGYYYNQKTTPQQPWSSTTSITAPPSAEDDEDDEAWAIALSAHHQLHEKLSSPKRQPPSPAETKRRVEERQMSAERNRGRLKEVRSQKLAEHHLHAANVKAQKKATEDRAKEAIMSRNTAASVRHRAFVETVRRKAVKESTKVEEVGFVTLTPKDVQVELQRRLNEVEARIEEARKRRERRLDGVRSRQTKRFRDRELQLSAQRVVRAEAAQQRWDQLQARLAAVEKRRAHRLAQRSHHHTHAPEPPPEEEEEAEEEELELAPPPPRSAPSSPQSPRRVEEPTAKKKKKKKKKKKLVVEEIAEVPAHPSSSEFPTEATVEAALAMLQRARRGSIIMRQTTASEHAAAAVLATAEALLKEETVEEKIIEGQDCSALVWALERWIAEEAPRLAFARDGDKAAEIARGVSKERLVLQKSLVAAAACDVIRKAVDFGEEPPSVLLLDKFLPELVARSPPFSESLAMSSLALVEALAKQQHSNLFLGGDKSCAAAVVAALGEACLNTPRGHDAKWQVVRLGLRTLNRLAQLDPAQLNREVFAAPTIQPQLLHVCDRVFEDANTTKQLVGKQRIVCGAPTPLNNRKLLEATLDELLELVGHLALRNKECVQWCSASRPTLLQRLVGLPISYFQKKKRDVLFPTLVAACAQNDRNSAVVAKGLSMRTIADYIRQPESAAAFQGRVPQEIVQPAAEYFDKIDDNIADIEDAAPIIVAGTDESTAAS